MGHCWIIPPRLSLFVIVFPVSKLFSIIANVTSRGDAITKILHCSKSAAHMPRNMLHFPAFEYQQDVKEWDHPGKRRGNAINCRLSNYNYAVSPGSCLHVGIFLRNKGNWAIARSMNAPVMSNQLFKQIAGLLVVQLNHAILFKTVYIYITALLRIFY